ncbi:hypothetical protein KSP39_PZI005798 [Platanthera zijinensis]|uniref:Uncharacterized protein n=1 Tax=Platanthera zijinensis TaxID=2320716 RepID=A0AAP0BSD6_9ASPA
MYGPLLGQSSTCLKDLVTRQQEIWQTLETSQTEYSQGFSRIEAEILKLNAALQQSSKQMSKEMYLFRQDLTTLLKSTPNVSYSNQYNSWNSFGARGQYPSDIPENFPFGQPINSYSYQSEWSVNDVATPSLYNVTTPCYYDTDTSNSYGAAIAPSSYGAAVAPSPYGAAVAPSSYGAAFAPSPFGAVVAPSSYGAAFAPSSFGGAVAPSSYGAAFAPSPFGSAVAPSSYGAAFAPSPFGAAVAPSSYGAAVTPSSYGTAVGPSPYGAAVTPSSYGAAVASSSYGAAVAPSACAATIVPSSYGGTAVPSARTANVAPSACIATTAPNLCGATAALPNATLLPNPSTSIGDAHSKRIIEDKHEIIDDIDTQQWTRVPVIICIEEEQQGVIQANNLLHASIAANLVSSPMEVLSFAPVVLDISDNTVLPSLKELMQHHPNSNVITGSLAHVTQVGRPHDNTTVRSHVSTWTIHVFDPGGCGVSIHSTYVEPQINKFQDADLVLISISRVIWVFDPGGIKRRGRRLNGKGRNVTVVSHVANNYWQWSLVCLYK